MIKFKYDFWKWLFKLSYKNFRKANLNRYRNDMKCPNCKEWFSISGVNHKHENVSHPDFGFHFKCGQCKHETYWSAVLAPTLVLCDERGNPL